MMRKMRQHIRRDAEWIKRPPPSHSLLCRVCTLGLAQLQQAGTRGSTTKHLRRSDEHLVKKVEWPNLPPITMEKLQSRLGRRVIP